MRTGPLERLAERRARNRRRRRARRRSDLNRSDAEVARLQRQRRRSARRRARRIQRARRAAQRDARPRRWRDRPGRTRRAEARLQRSLRLDTLRQKLPALSWYRGLPERDHIARWEIVALVLVTAAASVGVATSGKNLTGSPGIDVGWAVAAGTVVAIAGTRAPRRVLLGCGALAAAGVTGWWSVAGLAAMALASGLVYRRRGRIVGLRVMHAASAALTLVALVRIPPVRGLPSETAWTLGALGVAALAIAAIVVTGWWNSPRVVRTVTGVLAGVGLAAVVALTGALWSTIGQVPVGEDIEFVAAGTTEGTTDLAASAASLQQAAPAVNDLAARLRSPWWEPLRSVPLIAQQLAALDASVGGANDLIEQAGVGAALVREPSLRPAPGSVDLDALEALEQPLADLLDTIDATDKRLDAARQSLLLPSVANVVETLQGATTEARPATALALDGTRAIASMLGADGPRLWLVQIVSPGGNQVQLVEAADGTLIPVDRALDPTLAATLGDLSTNPDYPAAAASTAARLADAGLVVDGIMTLETEAAASLAEALGELRAPIDPPALILALRSAALPSPTELANTLGTAAAERRILLWSSDPAAQSFLESLGITGSLRRNTGGVDLVYVGLTAAGSNTPLPEVDRKLTYTTTFDAGSGETRTSARLELSQIAADAASSETGQPVDATLTIITGLDLNRFRVADIPRSARGGTISGWDQWELPVTIPASGAVTVQWSLQGQFPPFEYEFAWQPQSGSPSTQVTWRFAWTIYGSLGKYSTFIDRPLPTAFAYKAKVG